MTKKKKWIAVIALILAAGIAGAVYVLCNVTVVAVTDQYRITREFGQCYLTFYDRSYFKGNRKQNPEVLAMIEDYGLGFNSVDELVDDFMQGTFTEKEISNLKKHEHDVFGRIPIPDITNPHVPLFPKDLQLRNVVGVRDNGLSFSMEGPRSNKTLYYCNLSVTTRKAYLHRKDMMINLEKYTDQTLNSVVSKEKVEDRNATVYYGKSGKIIVYTIKTPITTLCIEEHYSSDGVPRYLQLVGESDGFYFTAYIQGFAQRPSVEWLSEFALVKYDLSQ